MVRGQVAEFSGLKKGTKVLTEDPFTFILYSRYRQQRCDFCFSRLNGNIQICTGCRFVGYCNPSCQSQAWSFHKIECPHLRTVKKPSLLPDAARLIARIVWKLTSGGDTDRGFYTKKEYRTFADLKSRIPQHGPQELRVAYFNEIYESLKCLLTDKYLPPYPVAMNIYGKICVNAFNILDEDMSNAGMGIYLGASVVDHSFKPNAVATFEGTKISITLIEDIPDCKTVDWSRIYISYVDIMEDPEYLQTITFEQYYLVRECPRIEDDPTLGERDNLKTQDDKDMYDYLLELTPRLLYEMAVYSTAYLDLLEPLIKMQRKVFHPLNIWHIRTLEAAFDSTSQMGLLDQALEYGKPLIKGYEHYYGEVHPQTAIIYMKIGKILLDKGDNSEAYYALKNAGEILEVTHGVEHSVYKNLLEPSMVKANEIQADAVAAARAAAALAKAAAPPPEEGEGEEEA